MARAVWGVVVIMAALAQAGELHVKTYTTADGLPNNVVLSLLQDTRGFLWIGTYGGITRFDGREFVTYDSSRGLPDAWGIEMEQDRDGRIWACTSRGLWRFPSREGPPVRGGFEVFLPGAAGPAPYVDGLAQDAGGIFWVGTHAGLFRFRPAAGGAGAPGSAFESIPFSAASPDDGVIHAVLTDRRGALWIGTRAGVHRRAPDGSVRRLTDAGVVSSLFEDHRGGVWVSTLHSALLHFPGGDSTKPPEICTTKHGLPSNRIECVYETSDKRLLVGTAEGLAEAVTPPNGRACQFRAWDLPKMKVGAILEDREGNLWLGSEGGLTQIPRARIVSYTAADGLLLPRVQSIFETHGGRLIIVSRQLNINWFEGGRLRNVLPNVVGAKQYPEWGWAESQAILEDRAGEWWVPTEVGLYRFAKPAKLEDLATATPLAIYTERHGLPGRATFRLFEDSRGDLWVSTVYTDPEGLSRLDRRTGRFVRQNVVGNSSRLPSGPPTAFREDRGGALWIGFYYGGVARYRAGKFTYFKPQDGAPGGFVRSILLDRRGALWFASLEGLTRLEDPAAEVPRFVTYTKTDGLWGRRVYCVAEDAFGRLYAGTDAGVDVLDPATFPAAGSITRLTARDGLPPGQVVLGFRDRDSRLWFAMGAGLSSLEPMPPQPQAAFPILVTALRVGGTDHPLSPWGEALLTRVELGPSQNHLEFGFVAPFFGAGEGPKYQHKLEGADADWSAADARRSIHYASLAPGRYRFQVRSVIAGAAAVPAARVEFTIQPPVWRRWWFQGLALACLCSLAYAFHRFRVRRAVELERVRMRIATDLHDELGAGLSQVAILSEVGKIEGRRDDALGKIGQLAREMLEATGDLVWAIRPHRDRLSDLVQRMRELAGDVLLESGVELRFTAPERDLRLGPDARRQVFLVFKECLHNVARHAGATAVEIDLSVEDHLLTLRVSDNGSGFRTDAVSGSATRHGLAGARWRAESLGGSFELVSEPGRGATARLRIPLRKSVGAQRRGLP